MNTNKKNRVGHEAQPCPRNRQEMRTGGPHHVSNIIPLCLAALTAKAQEGSNQHENSGKEECAV